jgi:hypothetical protein
MSRKAALVSFAILTFVSGVTSASAQSQATQLPMIKDVPVGAGVGNNVMIDVKGIKLGDEASGALNALNAMDMKYNSFMKELKKVGRFNEVSFTFDNLVETFAIEQAHGYMETFGLKFTPRLVGKRVYAIRRSINFGYSEVEQPLLKDVLQTLRDKYGPPTYEPQKKSRFASEVHDLTGTYVWHGGVLLSTDKAAKVNCSNYRNFDDPVWALVKHQRSESISLQSDYCEADLSFMISLAQLPDRVRNLTIEARDTARLVQAVKASTEYLEGLIQRGDEEKLKLPAGKAPKL